MERNGHKDLGTDRKKKRKRKRRQMEIMEQRKKE
jgi:hypothetical protein